MIHRHFHRHRHLRPAHLSRNAVEKRATLIRFSLFAFRFSYSLVLFSLWHIFDSGFRPVRFSLNRGTGQAEVDTIIP